ncbi:MAG: hypothetical protein OXE96_05860 [Gemmatimonadetes bacterium]|nr:hypothetical protein [Gemmatimonadota bacterium]
MHSAPVSLRRRLTRAYPVRIPSIAALLACTQSDTPDDPNFTPEPIASTALPPSANDQVALLADARTACVIDSYEVQVRCVDGEGAVVGVFGREGEGPGEFASPAYLARGEEGTVGVADLRLGRFTVFEPSGAYVSQVMMPGGGFPPLSSFGDILSGASMDVMALMRGEGVKMNRYDVNIASGEVVGDVESPPGPWDVECGEVVDGMGEVVDGIPNQTGGWVFNACEGHLIFVGDTGDATVLRAPTYVPQVPDEQEVAQREEELKAFNRERGFPESMNLEEPMQRFRTTPKNYHLSTAQQLFDDANRYWIATQRDLREWSYLDVYENAEYVGSVRVRDRIRGFDVLGSTLVVLVDRQVGADDDAVIPDRALDWYDLGEMPFGE